MLARSNKITHPLGGQFETPLLVPSFSSKGFSFKEDQVSEVVDILRLSQEFLTESMLISAYDVYHKHIPFSEEILCTELIILDSGGYETSEIYDLSANSKYCYPIKDWTHSKYEEIISLLPSHKAGVIVSYDHGKERYPLDLQVIKANELFAKYPSFLNDFLIKPKTDNQRYIQIDNILENIDLLKGFSIIGVTEKELDNSILSRMVNIAKIRNALDAIGNSAPIHIFGSLDPLTTLLYFLSGAEIFDGLTWLKYSYFQGSAIYQSNYGALDVDLGIHVRDSQVRSKSIVNNIYALEKMKYIMQNFKASGKYEFFDVFEKELPKYLKKAVQTLETKLKSK